MAVRQIEERVPALKRVLGTPLKLIRHDEFPAGCKSLRVFRNYPMYEEAMRLGLNIGNAPYVQNPPNDQHPNAIAKPHQPNPQRNNYPGTVTVEMFCLELII